MQRTIETITLPGLTPYAEGLARQRARREAVERGEAGNALFLLEHEAVFTLGRNFQSQNLLMSEEALEAEGISVARAERGGDVTYHGPGQLVAYPILNLNQWKLSIRWYLRALEQVLINLLAGCGLGARREEGLTGVWVGDAKVAAIGIGVHNWVTWHGIALNVNPDMSHFGYIVPCGIRDKSVTSLAQLMENSPGMEEVRTGFESAFREYFLNWDESPASL